MHFICIFHFAQKGPVKHFHNSHKYVRSARGVGRGLTYRQTELKTEPHIGANLKTLPANLWPLIRFAQRATCEYSGHEARLSTRQTFNDVIAVNLRPCASCSAHSPLLPLPLSLCFLSPPFRCAFINYVGFLMISALLLSRVLWPRLRFPLARFSFADKCTFFLASFPRPPFLPLIPLFNPSSTHTTFACFIAQVKSKLSAASFASKKRENFFTSSRS